MATSVPKPTFGPTGFIAPPEDAILVGVQADQNAAFDGNLNPALETPQGQLASSTTAIIGNANDTFVKQTQQVDPAYADGRYQDAIARIYFLTRNPAEPTVVQGKCSGLTGVVIPVGALARSADGNIYTCTQAGVIDGTGSITLSFACNIAGPITCPEGSLNQIYQNITGWDSIINLADGVVGRDVENRADFEARRAASVALNARGSVQAVLAAVLDVSGVLDAYVNENVNATPLTIQGATLVPKSLYVAAVGGAALDVATAIWKNKAPGCAYNGNTTETVFDTNSGYSPPYPSYQVTFENPDPLAILYAVNIANNPQVPSNASVLIQNAILAAFAGADGGPRARIGSIIYATRYIGPVVALGAWAQIISLNVGSNNNSGAVFTGSISGTVLTVSAVASGALATGQTISGPGIPAGITIASGGGGSWVISNNLGTISSETMVSAAPTLNDVLVQINQVPTLAAANIAVKLS